MPEAVSAIVDRFFGAMLGGESAEAEMRALFAEAGVYVEPFSGALRTHRGRDAAVRAMQGGWRAPSPALRFSVERVECEDGGARAAWICRSPILPGGETAGESRFLVRDGAIVRLETRLAAAVAADETKVDAYLAAVGPPLGSVAQALRAAIRAASPLLYEAWRWVEPVYEFAGPVCWLTASKAHVVLGFWRGADLATLEPRIETSGGRLGHINVDAGGLSPERVTDLVRRAMRMNRDCSVSTGAPRP